MCSLFIINLHEAIILIFVHFLTAELAMAKKIK